jgi:hypothetical protein
MIELVQESLEHVFFKQALPKPTNGRGIGDFVVIEGEVHETDKGQAIVQRFFRSHVTQVVSALQQENFKHGQGRVRRITDGVDNPFELLAQHFFKRPPVDETINLVPKAILALATGHHVISDVRILGSALTHVPLHLLDGENAA